MINKQQTPSAQPVVADRARRLRPRHVEVVRLAANGRQNAAIAREMGLSIHTVTDYWRVIKARLGVQSAPHAVAVALVVGLIGPADITVPDAPTVAEALR